MQLYHTEYYVVFKRCSLQSYVLYNLIGGAQQDVGQGLFSWLS